MRERWGERRPFQLDGNHNPAAASDVPLAHAKLHRLGKSNREAVCPLVGKRHGEFRDQVAGRRRSQFTWKSEGAIQIGEVEKQTDEIALLGGGVPQI